MAAITSSTEQGPEIGLRSYLVKEVLRDGTPVTIRAIRKDDQTSIRAAFRALDREAVYSRFFSPKTDLTNAELEQVTDLDFREVVALVATVSQGDDEIVIGDGRYATIRGDKLRHAELAFIVAQPYRGRGIASLLAELKRRLTSAATGTLTGKPSSRCRPMWLQWRQLLARGSRGCSGEPRGGAG